MFEKEAKEYSEKDLGDKYLSSVVAKDKVHAYKLGQYDGFVSGAEFAYNKANEWHNLNENSNDLPNEYEWVEGLYIWYYKNEPKWDVFKVRWYYELDELDEKLVCWYSSDDCWNEVDKPDYWRRIVLPTRNEHDRNY